MMISKFAIQAGLGVTVVGGGLGIAVWKLKKTPTAPNSAAADNNAMDSQSSDNIADDPDVSDGYLVKIPAIASTNLNDQPSDDLKLGEDKNYFCQWKSADKTQQEDKDCTIKQIKFDADKKVIFLSTIMEKFNSASDIDSTETSTLTTDNLKNKQNWFFLKIKGYKFDPVAAQNIDIVSSVEGNDKNKKYTFLTPKFKLDQNKATQGKTKTFLVKNSKDKSDDSITNFECKWNDSAAKECYIYQFGTQPTLSTDKKSIDAISLENTVKLNTSIVNNNYYIITFKSQEQVISSLDTSPVTIIVVEKKDNSNKKFGEFTVINPMIGIIGKTKVENLMLIN